MKYRILCWVGAVFALATAHAELVVYPDYPEQIERDYAYAVRVVQGDVRKPLTVYNHCEKSILNPRTRGGDVNRRFCEFAFSGGPVRVDIRVTEDVRCYKVFPSRLRLKSAFADGVISVWLEKPTSFGIQLNDYDKTILSVFGDAPEDPAKVPAKGAPGVLYVDRWLDAPGRDGIITTGKEVREIYVAPGAVLNARLKVRGPGTYVHGRGMVLDPLSDVFRFDQTQNTTRGLLGVSAPGVTVEDVKLVDARTFNYCSWAKDVTYRNVRALSSMMCSDGITCGGPGVRVEGAWLYVGDNALVVSGTRDAVFRDMVLGTSCAAIFPQSNNYGARLENVDVFRADDGLINNTYNGVLRRNNKWSEMNGGLQKREPGPQDLSHLTQQFFFANLSAVDCTLFSHFFFGHNMGTLPKTFAFRDLAIPFSTGRSDWRAIGQTNGVSIAVRNNPAKFLVTSNYTFAVTNLWLGGRKAAAFPSGTVVGDPGEISVSVAAAGESTPVVAAPDRHIVNWMCPYKVWIGASLQRDWRLIDIRGRREKRLAETVPAANIVAEPGRVRSLWQRVPSWLVKFEATGRDDKGAVIYRLVQCERRAGIQAVLTDPFLRRGNGTWRLAFDVKVKAETPSDLAIVLCSNEKRFEQKVPAPTDKWARREVAFETDFDLAQTELAALAILATAPTDEILFKNFSFTHAAR
ncbi:MAG: hypothetical protein IJJ84_07945 [Kiritimatiellae bacterium]|nr:hypothetical protein [Kiritimatiellia bacterium]